MDAQSLFARPQNRIVNPFPQDFAWRDFADGLQPSACEIR
jgi:hypothetical protein